MTVPVCVGWVLYMSERGRAFEQKAK